MIYAYFDECGQTDRDGRTFICGFLGNEVQWREATRLWLPAISPRSHLHVRALRFKNERRIRPLLARAGEIPDKAGLKPVGCSVRLSDYSDILTDQELRAGGSYVMCLYGAVLSALSLTPVKEKLTLVFGDQDTWEPFAQSALREMAEDPMVSQGRIASWSYVPADSCSIMGLADYYCFAKLQEARDPRSIKSLWTKPILNSNGGNMHCLEITSEESRRLAVDLKVTISAYIKRQVTLTGKQPEEIWALEKARREAHQVVLLAYRQNNDVSEHPDCAKWKA